MLKKLLHEPLLHFLLIGAALFLLYFVQNDTVTEGDGNSIIISQAHIERLTMLFEKQHQRQPSPQELNGLIDHQVREEIFYREALAMGLDKNDAGVRRRLAQKVKFIFSDIAEQAKPTEQQLAIYMNKHPEKFTIPGRISFMHIYFNSDKRGDQTHHDAEQLLSELNKNNPNVDIQQAGDRFLYGYQYEQLTKDEITSMFGENFANTLYKMSERSWQGPISTTYGVHLVRIIDKVLSIKPTLETVYDKVYQEWLSQQRQEMNEAFYQKLKQQYEIVVEAETERE